MYIASRLAICPYCYYIFSTSSAQQVPCQSAKLWVLCRAHTSLSSNGHLLTRSYGVSKEEPTTYESTHLRSGTQATKEGQIEDIHSRLEHCDSFSDVEMFF